jgi:hypothetical protein
MHIVNVFGVEDIDSVSEHTYNKLSKFKGTVSWEPAKSIIKIQLLTSRYFKKRGLSYI